MNIPADATIEQLEKLADELEEEILDGEQQIRFEYDHDRLSDDDLEEIADIETGIIQAQQLLQMVCNAINSKSDK